MSKGSSALDEAIFLSISWRVVDLFGYISDKFERTLEETVMGEGTVVSSISKDVELSGRRSGRVLSSDWIISGGIESWVERMRRRERKKHNIENHSVLSFHSWNIPCNEIPIPIVEQEITFQIPLPIEKSSEYTNKWRSEQDVQHIFFKVSICIIFDLHHVQLWVSMHTVMHHVPFQLWGSLPNDWRFIEAIIFRSPFYLPNRKLVLSHSLIAIFHTLLLS